MQQAKTYLLVNYVHIRWFMFCCGILFICSCNSNETQTKLPTAENFEVTQFNALANWNNFSPENKDQKLIYLDYYNAINTGFIIPSVRQIDNGNFTFTFKIKNKTSQNKSYLYKVYYRNDSYKYPELDSLTNKEHQYATENFYGSYENTDITFKTTPTITANSESGFITDSLHINGNPRNEQRYFEKGNNDRWKRNPRVGVYSFVLVVTENEDEKIIPENIKNISKKDGDVFKNPFYYFINGEGTKLKNTSVCIAPQTLKIVGKPDLGAGMYLNENDFKGVEKKNFYCPNCGYDTSLYLNAPFRQMSQAVETSTGFENIPVVMDVVGDNYTMMDYNWNRSFYTQEEMIKIYIESAHEPCKTVVSDTTNHKIVIRNPACEYGKWRKERVGIIGRHGMTYGKYRFKCKLTELLSKDGVWNGMTNAIWMIFPAGATEWNDRRICNKEGYMATYWGGYDDKKIPYSGYSEIDFEILKTVPYCPDCDFPPTYKNNVYDIRSMNDWNVGFPDDITKHRGDITVACTNWDMACPEPENYGDGCKSITYNGQEFLSHRWQKNYRALTQKSYQSDDELFGSPFYYFEIDWQPTQIIWRIGPSPDKMRIVGYMNDKVTMIANNQMLPIITQEWHNTKWWPGTPFDQGNIPFPAKDLVGEFFELVIE
nr:hypothetical protein [Bacteroidota bacterium]